MRVCGACSARNWAVCRCFDLTCSSVLPHELLRLCIWFSIFAQILLLNLGLWEYCDNPCADELLCHLMHVSQPQHQPSRFRFPTDHRIGAEHWRGRGLQYEWKLMFVPLATSPNTSVFTIGRPQFFTMRSLTSLFLPWSWELSSFWRATDNSGTGNLSDQGSRTRLADEDCTPLSRTAFLFLF